MLCQLTNYKVICQFTCYSKKLNLFKLFVKTEEFFKKENFTQQNLRELLNSRRLVEFCGSIRRWDGLFILEIKWEELKWIHPQLSVSPTGVSPPSPFCVYVPNGGSFISSFFSLGHGDFPY